MRKDKPSVLYVFEGLRQSIPWEEIKRAITAEFGRNRALTFAVTCSGADTSPAKAADLPSPSFDEFEAGKRPTLAAVARAAKVSTTTVSRVINDRWSVRPEIQQRVDAAIARLGYRPNEVARTLVRSKYLSDGQNADGNQVKSDAPPATAGARQGATARKCA